MKALPFSKIKDLFPDEWVLLADPEMAGLEILAGIVLFHHKDKKELTIQGRSLVLGFSNYRVVFTGQLPEVHRLGIMRKLKPA